MIRYFKGEDKFLSNFYIGNKFDYNGLTFNNTEAAFQSQKDLKEAEKFQSMTPGQAKKAGRKVHLRSDWDEVRDEIMIEVCVAKFTQDKELGEKLKATGTKQVVEGNNHHDNYWGRCNCPKSSCRNKRGKNTLGLILMLIRDEVL